MKTTLCIVDMQDTFASTKKALEGTLHQIKLAKRRKSDILVLELSGSGETVGAIQKELSNYDTNKVRFASKIGGDGSREFITASRNKGFYLNRIRVCGVNKCACVRSTLAGLKRELPKSRIEVAMGAISCGCGPYCTGFDTKFKEMGVVLK